ncbi:MAG: alanine--tRNA ligase [Coxiellaceae bacterium]|nr:alanine--tRNA ligase [Coxiellaceae bacterium]
MTSNDIRQTFLDYFKQHGHSIVPSSSLIPANDPTLLFTNAGMVQFKEYFLGSEPAPYDCATSSQRCVRAGGKHNDLENVGYTARHHTFFEMLGNFSFGKYFKQEAIAFAWDFLTNVLGLPKEKLWVSVYKDDKESENIWVNEIGVSKKRISRCGEKDNFWSMGDTGPCGPCTEVFYDHGEHIPGGPPGSPDEDGDRYIEIWNVVFMQYNRDGMGNMAPLPRPCVDTGMGLERISAILQDVHSNYEIDLFEVLLKALAKIVKTDELHNSSMHAVVDHIRSAAFLIIDGVIPSNEGRGYVLRRIIRRAIRHGYKLGIDNTFFYKLVQPLIEAMGEAYPELNEERETIERHLKAEEQQFAITLSKGLKILDHAILKLADDMIPGGVIFQLYDTYGFPLDLTADIARERGLQIDQVGFDHAMDEQRRQSQQASHFSVDYTEGLHLRDETSFTGYDTLTDNATVTTLLQEGHPIEQLVKGEKAEVVLDHTPFYAESGGQVGDKGVLRFPQGVFQVNDTQKFGKAYLHIGVVTAGDIKVNDEVLAEVDLSREQIKANHSATHLVHEALRRVLGKHVKQKGSLVDARRLRFDFVHHGAMTRDEITQAERMVNQKIRENIPAVIEQMNIDEAKARGAAALFGEKYGDIVRVLSFGDYSIELCGGTHVARTGDIGFFKIISEGACASGVRRIEAVTGGAADLWVEQQQGIQLQLAATLKTDPDKLADKVKQINIKQQELEKTVEKYKQRLASQQGDDIMSDFLETGGVQVLAKKLESADRASLRHTLDQLKQKVGSYAVVLAAVNDGKVELIAGVGGLDQPYFTAGELLGVVASQVGGRGGGRADLAQGGGDEPENLDAALRSVHEWVDQKIAVKQQG